MRLLTLLAVALLASPAAAKPLAVKAARLLDVRAGKYVDKPTVVIDDGKIVSVAANGPVPAGADVLDLGAVTLLPGLIDCHTHIVARMGQGPNDYLLDLATKSIAFRALEGAANARATLRAGFTTIRDVESEGTGYTDLALRDAINQGLVEGPRILASSRGIASVGRYMPEGVSSDLVRFPTGAQMVSGVEEARRAAREQLGHGADLLKMYADWGFRHTTFTLAELQVIVEEARRVGRRVAAHAMTPAGIKNAVDAGAASIEHGTLADRDALEHMKKRGVVLVPTVSVLEAMGPEAAKVAEAARRTVALARQVGVRIVVGSDAASPKGHGHNAAEIVAIHKAGVPALDAIRGATIWAAELLGLDKQIGAVEAGLAADLVAVAGDPLADVTELQRVKVVIKGGVLVR